MGSEIENDGLRPVCSNCGGSLVSLIGTVQLICIQCKSRFDMVQRNA
jgi:tRNA(Ile2) C34 agmatinyltransferase TiaS